MIQRSDRQSLLHFDVWLLGATLLLAVIGILMIYSATECITAEPLDWNSASVRQGLWLFAGLVAMAVLTFIDYRVYAMMRVPIWIGMVVILASVEIVGIITHGAQRWIPVGPFQFQPSEFTKLFIILVVAKFMADHEEQMKDWRYLLASFGYVAVPLVLVYLQPDLGTTIILALTWGIMALAAGMKMRDVLALAALLLVLAPFLVMTLRPYQIERLLTFVDSSRDPLGAGYNVEQARIAIGSGGFWGLGFCSGTQSQLRFLRIRQTDFIFSVIGEELGFVGALFVMALIVFILYRIIRAAMLSRTTYGKLVAIGVVAVIFMQSYVNLGMNLGLMPVTGIPLPFVSSGGSSLISLLAAEGVVQSIILRHHGLELSGSGKKYA